MIARKIGAGLVLLVVGGGVMLIPSAQSQQPDTQPGVEVQARGPIHEAFAALTAEAVPSMGVPKQPPAPLEEMAPAEKPEGDSIWIGGYWAWDDERKDFLWVSGIWRTIPPGRTWVAGYWRDGGSAGYQWVGGFWATAAKDERAAQDVTYLPAPPPLPNVAPPGPKPTPESFYVPGQWVYNGDRYVWQAGTYTTMAPGYVWVPSHYRWTPGGYVYIPGYWDYAIANRGILYAPVVIRPEVVRVGFVYTPAYAIRETVIVDSLWVRPTVGHYYFGDYYGPAYRDYGFESGVVYSRRHYDSIVVYETYEHRRQPDWITIQVNLYNDRYAGRAPVPPRTLVQQTNITRINQTNVYNLTVIAPAAQVAAAKGIKVTRLDDATRRAAVQQAVAVRQVSAQRTRTEAQIGAAGPLKRPSVQTLAVVKAAPVKPGFRPATVAREVAPVRPPAHPATTASGKTPIVGGTQTPAPTTTHPLGTQHPPLGNPLTTTRPGTPLTGPLGPGGRPLTSPPGHQPPPKDKDKDKDKDRRDR